VQWHGGEPVGSGGVIDRDDEGAPHVNALRAGGTRSWVVEKQWRLFTAHQLDGNVGRIAGFAHQGKHEFAIHTGAQPQ
jgi:hypothetical protein